MTTIMQAPWRRLKITVPHYYSNRERLSLPSSELASPDAWDAVRMGTSESFALPATRADWERLADDNPAIAQRAVYVNAWLEERSIDSVASYGVGGALLELWLMRLNPGRRLIVTEHSPRTRDRLATLFDGVDVVLHDLTRDPPIPAKAHLFHRIDTEFANDEWRQIFRRFSSDSMLLVAGQALDALGLIKELRRRLRRGALRAGYARTRAALESLWQDTHAGSELRVHDLQAWGLVPRRAGGDHHPAENPA